MHEPQTSSILPRFLVPPSSSKRNNVTSQLSSGPPQRKPHHLTLVLALRGGVYELSGPLRGSAGSSEPEFAGPRWCSVSHLQRISVSFDKVPALVQLRMEGARKARLLLPGWGQHGAVSQGMCVQRSHQASRGRHVILVFTLHADFLNQTINPLVWQRGLRCSPARMLGPWRHPAQTFVPRYWAGVGEGPRAAGVQRRGGSLGGCRGAWRPLTLAGNQRSRFLCVCFSSCENDSNPPGNWNRVSSPASRCSRWGQGPVVIITLCGSPLGNLLDNNLPDRMNNLVRRPRPRWNPGCLALSSLPSLLLVFLPPQCCRIRYFSRLLSPWQRMSSCFMCQRR